MAKQHEKIIQDEILGFLMSKRVFAFFINNSVAFDPKLGRFRKRNKWHRRGVSDIIALYLGKFVALEVKSLKGKPSPEQVMFLRDVTSNGGYSAIVRSTDDVEAVLKRIEQNCLEAKRG